MKMKKQRKPTLREQNIMLKSLLRYVLLTAPKDDPVELVDQNGDYGEPMDYAYKLYFAGLKAKRIAEIIGEPIEVEREFCPAQDKGLSSLMD
jgi:hypothetical protein